MKRFLILALLFVAHQISCEEVQRKVEVGDNGEEVTTVLYKNDSRNVEKEIYYGKSPLYRLIKVYYNKNNSAFLDYADYFNVVMGINGFPNGKAQKTVFYNQKNHPDKMIKSERTYEDVKIGDVTISCVVDDYFYGDGAPGGVTESIAYKIITKNNQELSRTETYKDTADNKEHFKKRASSYNVYGEIIGIDNYFYPTEPTHLSRMTILYLPEKFTIEKNLPWKRARTYENEPSGLLRIEEQFINEGEKIENAIYDPKISTNSFDQSTRYYRNNKIFRMIVRFDKPFQGKAKFEQIEFHPDGSWSEAYSDADSNPVDVN